MTEAQWILAAMLHVAPVEKLPQFPGYPETPLESRARYAEIAEVIADTCDDAKSVRGCTSMLVAIAAGESGFSRDTDIGPCYRKGAYWKRCDSGRAASVWQAQAWGVDWDGEKITVARLFADRHLAAWQTLRVARASLARCGGGVDSLSGLSGRCIKGEGPWRARYRLWQRVMVWEPPR